MLVARTVRTRVSGKIVWHKVQRSACGLGLSIGFAWALAPTGRCCPPVSKHVRLRAGSNICSNAFPHTVKIESQIVFTVKIESQIGRPMNFLWFSCGRHLSAPCDTPIEAFIGNPQDHEFYVCVCVFGVAFGVGRSISGEGDTKKGPPGQPTPFQQPLEATWGQKVIETCALLKPNTDFDPRIFEIMFLLLLCQTLFMFRSLSLCDPSI